MVGAAAKPLPETYRRREPEKTVLHQVVREHLETLLMESRAEGSGLPRYVEEEFRRHLECGILAAGFARCVCAQCGDELLVAFICKGKGFCPSCLARRMNDTAAPSRSRAARGAVSAMGDGVSAAAPLGICARSEGCRMPFAQIIGELRQVGFDGAVVFELFPSRLSDQAAAVAKGAAVIKAALRAR